MGYAWPPRPVLDVDEAVRIFSTNLGELWEVLEARRLRVLADPTNLRRAEVERTISEWQAAVKAAQAGADTQVRSFIARHLEPRYQAGVTQAQGGTLAWTQGHQDAMAALSVDTYDDFLERSVEAGQTSEKFATALRSAARSSVFTTSLPGTTAVQAGAKFAELVESYGVDVVTYADGTKMPVRHYADMAARTKSAVAYNAGSINGYVEAGVRFVEVFDGPSCGWTKHSDTDLAAGSIRHVSEAYSYPISHPRCQRSFGARPDVQTRQDVRGATPSTTEAQRADSALVEAARISSSSAPAVTRAASKARQVRNAKRASRTA